MTKKVLFLDSVHPILRQRLEALGYDCEEGFDLSKAQLIASISNYSGLVIRSRLTIDASVLKPASNLIFIARSGSGMENIDVAFAEEQGILCFNSPEGNRDAVGEHALALLLALYNHLPSGNRETKDGIWRREAHRGRELAGKTVGIIGYGQMGSAFAEKLAGFRCHVLAHDKYKQNFGSELVSEVGLAQLFESCDIISMHLPLTEETHHYVNHDFLERFVKPICVINTARGKIIDQHALVEALKNGRVSGACLDVVAQENSAFHMENAPLNQDDFRYLAAAENVIMSPHVAGWTTESYEKLSAVLADKIEAAFHT